MDHIHIETNPTTSYTFHQPISSELNESAEVGSDKKEIRNI